MPEVPILARRSLFEWITLVCRLVLGGVLAYAGAIKLPNLEESVLAVMRYKIPFLTYDLAVIIGYAQPILEVAVGLLLIIGLFTRWSAAAGALSMVVFIVAIVSVWARGISIDCGCFGGGAEVAKEVALANYPKDIARDVGLLLAGAWAAWKPRSPFAVDTWLFAPVVVDEPDDLDEADDLDQGDPND